MTKVDRVTREGRERDISPELFKEREDRFIQALGLLGATTRYCSVSNYCDDTDKERKRRTSVIPAIDAPLLEFMTQVCDPAIRVINPQFTFTGEDAATESQTNVRRRRRPQETEDNTQNEQNEPPQEMDQNKQKEPTEPAPDTDQNKHTKLPQEAKQRKQNEKTQITKTNSSDLCLSVFVVSMAAVCIVISILFLFKA